jgi:hypothetical protein
MFRSAISVTSRSGLSAATAIWRIGMAPGSNFWMTGARAVSGRSGMTRLILSRTSWAATSPLFSSRNVMMTCDWPSTEDDRSASMPLIVLTAPSIFLVISVSICSGDAPGLVTDTDTVGTSMFGSRSTPRPMNE